MLITSLLDELKAKFTLEEIAAFLKTGVKTIVKDRKAHNKKEDEDAAVLVDKKAEILRELEEAKDALVRDLAASGASLIGRLASFCVLHLLHLLLLSLCSQ